MVAMMFSSPLIMSARADGGVVAEYEETFFYQLEKEQYAIIDHDDGYQDMFLSISVDWREAETAAWILPVPSVPVSLDLAGLAPSVTGTDIIRQAREDLKDTIVLAAGAYAGSILLGLPMYVWVTSLADTSEGVDGGVSVHQHLEKYGLTVEVISAKAGEDIYSCLGNMSIDVSPGSIDPLDLYAKKGYAFIVTWLTGPEVTVSEPGLIFRFPTDRMFYPMMLTSVYGDKVIPTELFLKGLVTPDVYSAISGYTRVDYFRDGYIGEGYWAEGGYRTDPEVRNFTRFFSNDWDGEFTRVLIDAPAKALEEDLWFDSGLSGKDAMKVRYARGVSEGSALLCMGLLFMHIAFSMVAAYVTGRAVFGPNERHYRPLSFALGAIHLLGLLMFLIFAAVMLNHYRLRAGKSVAFVYTFVGTYFVMTFGCMLLLLLPLV